MYCIFHKFVSDVIKINTAKQLVVMTILCSFVNVYALFCQTKKNIQPNIIFILSDDHSVPYLGCYNNKDIKTPNIDRIAKEGMRFDHAYTTAPQCVPSRASLMTGRSPVDINMTRFAAPLPLDVITFPELLRKAGYFTGIAGRYYHLDGPANDLPGTNEVYKKYKLKTFQSRVDYLENGDNNSVLDQFQDFLQKVPKDKPFFIQLGYEDPHYPFTARNLEPDPLLITIPAGMPDLPATRLYLSQHIGAIQHLDSLVGLLLTEIDNRKLADNTVLIFMGDNGAALLRGKGTLYDAGLHVPLLIRWPKQIKPGSSSEILISGEDIAPSFLDIAGAATPVSFTGKSFVPAFSGSQKENHEYIFAERGAHGTALPNTTAAFDLSRTVFNKKYKLIYNTLWQLPYTPVDFEEDLLWLQLKAFHQAGKLDTIYERLFFAAYRPMFELYDLVKDPAELNNLIDDKAYSEKVYELKSVLQQWMLVYQDYLPLPIPPVKHAD